VIVSRGRRYIFVHAPKTGGTAMTLALETRAMADDILVGDTPKARRRRHRLAEVQTAGQLWKHARLADIAGLVTPDEMDAFFVFTLVRNPWDRMVSYYHWLSAQGFAHPAVARAQALDFGGFLADPGLAASVRANPYGAYVRRPDGRETCDLFLRREHLDDDIAPLAAHLGFRPVLPPGVNRSDRQRDWRPYYGDAEAARVADLCAEDIARFGYRFDDPVPG